MKQWRRKVLVVVLIGLVLIILLDRSVGILIGQLARKNLKGISSLKVEFRELRASLISRCLEIKELSLSIPKVFENEKLIVAKRLTVWFSLLPLWKRELHLKSLEIYSPQAKVIFLPDGSHSFSYLAKLFPGKGSAGFNLIVQRILISDGQLLMMDFPSKNLQVALTEIYFQGENGSGGNNQKWQVDFFLSGLLDNKEISLPFRFKGRGMIIDSLVSIFIEDALGPLVVNSLKELVFFPGFSLNDGTLAMKGKTRLTNRLMKSRQQISINGVRIQPVVTGQKESDKVTNKFIWTVDLEQLEADFSLGVRIR
ncbi:MAG: hypothetical protein NC911_08635 [Candidatus Omnitrophica bacterium]|nr:hypothetical protein [Candidatus Omnitrophota bacterium]